MPQGLIIRDEGNAVVLDTTTRVARVIGIQTLNKANGSVVAAAEPGALWFLLINRVSGTDDTLQSVVASGNTITWAYNVDGHPDNLVCDMIWGRF